MALFFRDDYSYNLGVRQTGFNRYRQLLSFHAVHWIKLNLLTVAGALPLTAAIVFSLLSSSVLVLIPASFVGGMIFGPFLAGLFDSIMRGMRDAPGNWWTNYKKSWRQNTRSSLLPGGLLGLITGMYVFMMYLLWYARTFPGWGTLALYLFGALLFIILNTLYWPQLVLFEQSLRLRLINIILFTSKYLWKVLGVALLQLGYLLLFLLFAPWTLILVPLIGLWFILFLSQLILYDALNESLHIEEQYIPVEGDPWAKDPFEQEMEEEEI